MDIETLYREYHDKILNYVRKKVNNADDAEDICADVFLKVQKHLLEYDEEKASASTWIYAIARNAVIDFYRCNHVEDEISEEIASGEEIDRGLLDRETLEELAEALKKLSDEERAVIIFRYYEGLSLRDIEARTGMSYGQVKLRHNSALKSMRVFFEKKTAKGGFRIV